MFPYLKNIVIMLPNTDGVIPSISRKNTSLNADFHSAEFSDWTGSPLFTCENVAFGLKSMLHVSKNLLCQIQSPWKILLSGNQPLQNEGLRSKRRLHNVRKPSVSFEKHAIINNMDIYHKE